MRFLAFIALISLANGEKCLMGQLGKNHTEVKVPQGTQCFIRLVFSVNCSSVEIEGYVSVWDDNQEKCTVSAYTVSEVTELRCLLDPVFELQEYLYLASGDCFPKIDSELHLFLKDSKESSLSSEGEKENEEPQKKSKAEEYIIWTISWSVVVLFCTYFWWVVIDGLAKRRPPGHGVPAYAVRQAVALFPLVSFTVGSLFASFYAMIREAYGKTDDASGFTIMTYYFIGMTAASSTIFYVCKALIHREHFKLSLDFGAAAWIGVVFMGASSIPGAFSGYYALGGYVVNFLGMLMATICVVPPAIRSLMKLYDRLYGNRIGQNDAAPPVPEPRIMRRPARSRQRIQLDNELEQRQINMADLSPS